jgi:hypothetical protein
MSTRTIIEINHDFCGDLERRPEIFRALLLYLRGGDFPGNDKFALASHGITVLRQRHHSERVILEVE